MERKAKMETGGAKIGQKSPPEDALAGKSW
jgi:hypothetical protein